jgi:pSer/pThr/pTyr-binding forkhead associated (FHA) protein
MSTKNLTDEELTTQLAQRAALAPATSTAWTLEVLSGPDRGKRFDITDVVTRRVLIGQSPASDVPLTDRSASRRHAAIESDGSGARIVDLGSRNGTFVGSVRVRDAYITPGEVVRIGDTQPRSAASSAVSTTRRETSTQQTEYRNPNW